MPQGKSIAPLINCRNELNAPPEHRVLRDGRTTGKELLKQWIAKWPPVMVAKSLTRTAPSSRVIANGFASSTREVIPFCSSFIVMHS